MVFWIFALGWATAQATTRRGTGWLLSVLTVVTVPGFFPEGARDAYVAAGLLALVWVPAPPAARRRWPASPAVLAAASLWIYLLHWQVYPHLEHRIPWLATVLSLAVGVAAAVARGPGGRRRRTPASGIR